MLALMFNVAEWLIRENDQILITFESPEHGSFKSNHQVQQRLLAWGWWLSKVDYCAVADVELDGAVYEEGDMHMVWGEVFGQKRPRSFFIMGLVT